MKFGFDLHGVLDTHFELYATLTSALAQAGHEVHIITGRLHHGDTTSDVADQAAYIYTHATSNMESFVQGQLHVV